MSCYNYCGYNPCGYYNPCCYNPCCCYCYNVTLRPAGSITTLALSDPTTLILSFTNPTGGWSGSGSFNFTAPAGSTTLTNPTGSATFSYNSQCCPPSFTVPITVSGNFTGSGGKLTITINGCSATVSGSIVLTNTDPGESGTVTFNGSGCLCGCGPNKTVTINPVTISGTLS